ncbi:hypothetical protein V6N13_024636 [Hibiscus sabdariffa]
MQWYILTNCDEVEPYMKKHKMEFQLQNTLSIEERHKAEFPLWFRNYVSNQVSKEVYDELLSLAYGPDKRAQKYTGNMDVLIDSNQESGDDNEEDEIELDEYDTDIENIL